MQAQLLQLQRYRENVVAQMDALSNHAINQTYVQAVRGASELRKGLMTVEDAESAFEGINESMQGIKEVSEFLGQPLIQDVTDEDLEREFLEDIGPREEQQPFLTAPVAPVSTAVVAPTTSSVGVQPLRVAAALG